VIGRFPCYPKKQTTKKGVAVMQTYPQTDPRHYTQKIQTRLDELIEELRQDIKKVEEPQARALFETSAEVLEGLKTAYAHYEQKTEAAWR
jgi:transcription initiation factor IIE alpha subunit